MSSESFKFKKFTIHHDRCSMKVGTDGVLLGSWVDIDGNEGRGKGEYEDWNNADSKDRNIADGGEIYDVLDIGTGSGLIAMMIAQRSCYKRIIAIDIDADSVNQALANIDGSMFKGRIETRVCDFSQIGSEDCNENVMWLKGKMFRHIVSNPPFYEEETVNRTEKMSNAKHTTTLSFEQLIKGAESLMHQDADFSVIIPFAAAQRFISIAAINGLFLARRTDVRNNESKPFKRSLLTFRKNIVPTIHSTLTLRNTDNSYSDDYTAMTNEFYL